MHAAVGYGNTDSKLGVALVLQRYRDIAKYIDMKFNVRFHLQIILKRYRNNLTALQ